MTPIMPALRSPVLSNILGIANLTVVGAATVYFKSHHERNLLQHESRMDELEGTLRGHIGLMEDALERLEAGQQQHQRHKNSSKHTSGADDPDP
jgi:hypothetical protein